MLTFADGREHAECSKREGYPGSVQGLSPLVSKFTAQPRPQPAQLGNDLSGDFNGAAWRAMLDSLDISAGQSDTILGSNIGIVKRGNSSKVKMIERFGLTSLDTESCRDAQGYQNW